MGIKKLRNHRRNAKLYFQVTFTLSLTSALLKLPNVDDVRALLSHAAGNENQCSNYMPLASITVAPGRVLLRANAPYSASSPHFRREKRASKTRADPQGQEDIPRSMIYTDSCQSFAKEIRLLIGWFLRFARNWPMTSKLMNCVRHFPFLIL